MTRRPVAVLLAALLLSTPACSIRGSSGSESPARTGPTLDFVEHDLGGGLVAPIPAGWTAPDPAFPRVFRPPEGGKLRREVTLWWVDDPCPEPCGRRSDAEWPAVLRAGEFAQFEDSSAFEEILRDESVPGRLLVEARNNFGVVALNIARWQEAGSRYLACRASVPVEHAALLAGFEQACDATALPSR